MKLRTYNVINMRKGETEAVVACTPPYTNKSQNPDWKDLFRALDQLTLPHVWVGGILDGDAIWLLDSYGYASHYLEPTDMVRKDSGDDRCPKCGQRGVFVRMALVCKKHGAFAGI